MHHRSHRRATAGAALAGLTALVGACGSNAHQTSPTTVASTTTSATTAVATSASVTTVASTASGASSSTAAPASTPSGPPSPLTGLPSANAATLGRPALVVKINNHPLARPQIGLNQADVVFEEEVEGITRFAAVFQSTDSTPVGPVRSARTSDVDIVAQLSHPLFAWSGGNAGVQRAISRADLTDVGASAHYEPGGFFRDNRGHPGIAVEHTLFADTVKLFAEAPAGQGAPAPLFTYRAAGVASTGDAVGTVKLAMDGTPVEYTWDANVKGWARTEYGTPHVDDKGVRVAPANVVILFTNYRRSPADPKSPEAITIGHGDAWVLTDGKIVKGTWDRPDGAKPATLTDASGQAIALTPGRTWVELPRPGEGTAA